MNINLANYQKFDQGVNGVFFSRKDIKKIKRMKGKAYVVSTVCPDYPNNGEKYTFKGQLGGGVSLTAKQHLDLVPKLIEHLRLTGLEIEWQVVVADLPELVPSQKEFYEKVAGTKEAYLEKCKESAMSIKAQTNGYSKVMTFRDFHDEEYLNLQIEVSEAILKLADTNQKFKSKFNSFMMSRVELANSFRGRSLSTEELKEAAAHGMSLYVSHGTLIRKKFTEKNVIVINHLTPNLQNFFMAKLVRGYEYLENTEKFPIGIIEGKMY